VAGVLARARRPGPDARSSPGSPLGRVDRSAAAALAHGGVVRRPQPGQVIAASRSLPFPPVASPSGSRRRRDTSDCTAVPSRDERVLQVLFFALVVRPSCLFIGCGCAGASKLPAADPFVLIANHTSHLDTVSLLSLFPLRRLGRVRPVARRTTSSARGWCRSCRTRCSTILPVERRRVTRSRTPAAHARGARAGESLVLFPEAPRRRRRAGPLPAGRGALAEAAPDVPSCAYLVNMGRRCPRGVAAVPSSARCAGPPRTAGRPRRDPPPLEAAVAALSG